MESKKIEVSGETINIEVGDTFIVNKLLNFGADRQPIEPETEVTLENISRYPDGIHFEFRPEGEERTEIIYQFALENTIEQGHMKQK